MTERVGRLKGKLFKPIKRVNLVKSQTSCLRTRRVSRPPARFRSSPITSNLQPRRSSSPRSSELKSRKKVIVVETQLNVPLISEVTVSNVDPVQPSPVPSGTSRRTRLFKLMSAPPQRRSPSPSPPRRVVLRDRSPPDSRRRVVLSDHNSPSNPSTTHLLTDQQQQTSRLAFSTPHFSVDNFNLSLEEGEVPNLAKPLTPPDSPPSFLNTPPVSPLEIIIEEPPPPRAEPSLLQGRLPQGSALPAWMSQVIEAASADDPPEDELDSNHILTINAQPEDLNFSPTSPPLPTRTSTPVPQKGEKEKETASHPSSPALVPPLVIDNQVENKDLRNNLNLRAKKIKKGKFEKRVSTLQHLTGANRAPLGVGAGRKKPTPPPRYIPPLIPPPLTRHSEPAQSPPQERPYNLSSRKPLSLRRPANYTGPPGGRLQFSGRLRSILSPPPPPSYSAPQYYPCPDRTFCSSRFEALTAEVTRQRSTIDFLHQRAQSAEESCNKAQEVIDCFKIETDSLKGRLSEAIHCLQQAELRIPRANLSWAGPPQK